jgi:hypothetical protein
MGGEVEYVVLVVPINGKFWGKEKFGKREDA